MNTDKDVTCQIGIVIHDGTVLCGKDPEDECPYKRIAELTALWTHPNDGALTPDQPDMLRLSARYLRTFNTELAFGLASQLEQLAERAKSALKK